MKKPDLWMPLYIADYLADTQRLTTEGHGAYLLLIMDYWMAGPLPDDDDQLAAVTKMGVKEWKRMRLKLEPFFNIADGHWRHKRIDLEKGGAQDIIDKRSKAGTAGAAKRWQSHSVANGKDVADAVAKGMADGMASAKQTDAPTQLNTPTPKAKTNPKSKHSSGKPDYPPQFVSLWTAYPRKVAKGAALKAWLKLSPDDALAEQILAAVAAARWSNDRAFIPHPATWLNDRRWEDEVEPRKRQVSL